MRTDKLDLRAGLASLVMIGIILFSPPLFVIERYSLYSINKLAIAVLIAGLAAIAVRKLAVDRSAANLVLMALLQTALLLTLPFAHQSFGYGFDAGYFNVSFQVLAATAIFVILTSSDRVRFFASFWVNLHLVIGALGVLVFVGGLTVNLQPVAMFGDRPYYDFGLAYSNVFYQIGGINVIRVAGFYDEPGTFAFYVTFALVIARLFELPRWKELALIAFGLPSLSMAFFIVAFVWLALTLNRRHVLYLALLVGLVFVGIARIDQPTREQLALITVDRFGVSDVDDRLVRGDNRTAIMRDNYVAFLDAPLIGHGLHYEGHVGDSYRHSFIANPVAPLATHGIIGASAYNLHVFALFLALIFARRIRRRERLLVLTVLLLTLAQRPTTINGLGYLLFIIMTYWVIKSPRLIEFKMLTAPATETGGMRRQ